MLAVTQLLRVFSFSTSLVSYEQKNVCCTLQRTFFLHLCMDNNLEPLEFNEPDKLDKYKDYLLGRGILKAADLRMLEKYRKAFSWRCKAFSPQMVKDMLMRDEGLQYAQAARILQEATELYGRIEDIDTEGTKKILIENLYLAMSIAIKNKDANAVIAATKEIGKLTKVYSDIPIITIDELMPKRQLVFNTVTVHNNYTEGKEVEDYDISEE